MQNKINITFEKDALRRLAPLLQLKSYSSLFVLVDENTKKHCLPLFFEQTGLNEAIVLSIPPGEEHKHLTTCETVWNQLSEEGADRNSALINLGGGVVTDLGGFVACTFKRGIDFYNIPTTLLAMVDASVGGKTGIDLGALKNQIGIIEEPKQVIIHPQWLATLPQKELRSGFADMRKDGLIADATYWSKLRQLQKLDAEVLSAFIAPSVAIKKEVVLQDPREKSLRKILNFGHTLGHAIESYFLTHSQKKRLLHGEAIAVGMVLEAYLSSVCCGLSSLEAEEIKRVFAYFFPKVDIEKEDQMGILALLRHDKKNSAGRINFVLLNAIGSPKIDIVVSEEHFTKAFEFYSKD
ncbi:MAG: 3-dehydroquinate synthase [Flavobacteriaceae bacterium]